MKKIKLPTIDIYSQKNIYQIFIGINLALVGIASIFYTYNIVESIEIREKRQLTIFAQLLEYQANQPSLTDDFTDLFEITSENIKLSRIPTIIADKDLKPVYGINLDLLPNATPTQNQQLLQEAFEEIKDDNPPYRVNLGGIEQWIYFSDSPLLVQMRYYPYVQLISILVLSFLAYLVFSASRTAEQNRVWVGLAKETAHQLGTPIASLMGWVEVFRSEPEKYPLEYTTEIEKDIKRLEMITTRFSSIGSAPTLKQEDVGEVVGTFLNYLKRRISTKVSLEFKDELPRTQRIELNRNLFEWVIENICKNAVDAMNGAGGLHVRLFQLNKEEIAIDIADTGKGIPRTHWQKVFKPGVSSKKRGWGLGLTLAKRIVEEYHGGRLFVKNSEIGKGTTFRIVLRKG